MKALNSLLATLLLSYSLAACGLSHEHPPLTTMDTSKITNSAVRSAIEAWQRGDSGQWLSFFTADAKLFDDGHPRDFRDFSTNVIGSERFTTIDRVTEKGARVVGHFYTEKWGDFKASFRFHFDAAGKVYRLDIDQVTE